jgi:hypothetical protein
MLPRIGSGSTKFRDKDLRLAKSLKSTPAVSASIDCAYGLFIIEMRERAAIKLAAGKVYEEMKTEAQSKAQHELTKSQRFSN